MDPNRFREAYGRLKSLEERSTYRIRPKTGLSRATPEQLEERLRDLANYTIELREIVDDLFQAIAAKPQ